MENAKKKQKTTDICRTYKQNSIKEKGIKITLGMRKNRINMLKIKSVM